MTFATCSTSFTADGFYRALSRAFAMRVINTFACNLFSLGCWFIFLLVCFKHCYDSFGIPYSTVSEVVPITPLRVSSLALTCEFISGLCKDEKDLNFGMLLSKTEQISSISWGEIPLGFDIQGISNLPIWQIMSQAHKLKSPCFVFCVQTIFVE